MRIAFTSTLAAGVEHALQKFSGVLAPASVSISALYDPVGWIPYKQVDQGLKYGHVAEVRLAALTCLLT